MRVRHRAVGDDLQGCLVRLVDRDRERLAVGRREVEPTEPAVSIPITAPELSTSGPPESPGWIAALVWIKPESCSLAPPTRRRRDRLVEPVIQPPALDGVPPVPPRCRPRRRRRRRRALEESPSLAVPDRWRLELENGEIVARVLAEHGRGVPLAVPDVGGGDLRRPVDHVIVREHLAVRADDDAGARAGRALVAEVRVDVDEARIDPSGDRGGVRGRAAGRVVEPLPMFRSCRRCPRLRRRRSLTGRPGRVARGGAVGRQPGRRTRRRPELVAERRPGSCRREDGEDEDGDDRRKLPPRRA